MSSRFKWLDWDIENRPLSYLGSDFTTADITAIAFGWADEDEVHVEVQTKDDRSRRRMLRNFYKFYVEADGVTGHNIRSHDLRLVNGMLLEEDMPLLTPKLTCDTYGDLKKKSGISSSQENLCDMLGIEAPKIQMNTPKWREANRLTHAGIEKTRARAVGDVVQHKQLRLRLVELDMLHAPKVWRP